MRFGLQPDGASSRLGHHTMRIRIAQLMLVVGVALCVVGGLVSPVSATGGGSQLPSVDNAGASCIAAISDDSVDIVAITVNSQTIALRCYYSDANAARTGTTYDGDGDYSTFNSLATGSTVTFNNSAQTKGITCTVASGSVVKNHANTPATFADHFAEAQFKCSALSGFFGSGSPYVPKTGFLFTVNGGNKYTGLLIGHIRAVTGGTTAAPTTATVAWANLATTYPAYWWVADSSPAPETFFCGIAVTSMTVTTPSGNVQTGAGSLVAPGNVVRLVGTRLASRSASFEVQWWPGGPWVSIFATGYFSLSFSEDRTVAVKPGTSSGAGQSFVLGDAKIRCLDLTTQTFTYGVLGDSFSGAGSTQVGRPCDLVQIYWPQPAQRFAGTAVQFGYNYSGILNPIYVGDSGISISVSVTDPTAAVLPLTSGSRTWTTVQTTVQLGAQGTFNATAGFDAGNDQFSLRCTDRDGNFFSTALAPHDVVGDDSANCLVDAGIGLAPKSWLPGMFRMGQCIVKVWAVPSPGFIEGLTADRPAGWLSTPLTQFTRVLTGVVDLVTVSDAQVAAGDCGFAFDLGGTLDSSGVPGAGSTLEGGQLSYNVCGSSQERTLVTISRYLSLAGIGWMLLLYVRRALDARS